MSIPQSPNYSNDFKGFVDIIKYSAKQEVHNLRDGTTQKIIKSQINEKMDLHPELTRLNNTPNSRFNDEQLAKRLVAKYKDPAKINAAIDQIMQKDVRFNNTQPDEFEVSHRRLEAIKEQVDKLAKSSQNTAKPHVESTSIAGTNTPISDADLASPYKAARREEKREKLQKNIASDLVGLINRQPTAASKFKGIDGKQHHMKQTPGHMEAGKFVTGYTVSAELSNKDAKVLELPNQAVITFHSTDPDQADEVILGRSGRSDMQGKIDDKSQLDILSRLESKTKKGLKEKKDAQGHIYYEYQRADVTMMDTNILKSAKTKVMSSSKRIQNVAGGKPAIPVESERQFVHSKRQAIKERWAAGAQDPARAGRRYLERDMTTADGKPHKVREYEPFVWNFVFSSSAKLPGAVKAARQNNIPNALDLFSQLQNEPDFAVLTELTALNTSTKAGRRQLAQAVKDKLNAEPDSLSRNQMLALKAVLVTLTGRDEKGKSYDNTDGADVQFILLNHLADVTGTAITVECKSGNDRTATAMALRCSLKEFENVFGRRYDPTTPDYISPKNQAKGQTRTDLDRMKTRFNKYAYEFGAPNVKASRGIDALGHAVLKVFTSPVFQKYGDIEEMREFFNLA